MNKWINIDKKFNKPGIKRLTIEEYAVMAKAKKEVTTNKGALEYEILDQALYPDGRVVVKFPKRMDEASNKYLEEEIMKPLIADGYKYFFYDMREHCETINSATLRIVLLSQQPMVSYMGRIMFIFNNKLPEKSTLWEILNKTNFVREQDDTEHTIFGRWDTIEEAMAWIPKDVARRELVRSQPQEDE